MTDTAAHRSSIDPDEVARFAQSADTWWDASGPMRALHRLNPVRLAYVRDAAVRRFARQARAARPLEGLTVLDVGCGGGLLSEPLARLGAAVTGIDPAAANVEVAREHARQGGLAVEYRDTTVETLVAETRAFDIVLALEVIEHVPDPRAFVAATAAAVKPGGLLVMATLNRTVRAFALAVVGAEYVLGWLPKGTHRWDKFVTPGELEGYIEDAGPRVIDISGVVYNPLADAWRLSRDTAVNYMVSAVRD